MSNIYPIHKAPYTNFHDLNLDWIIDALNEFNTKITNFITLATIKYADPIQWDITSQYETNTVVVDINGNAYLSVQPVPSGVSLDRTEFWTKIGNFDKLWANVKKAITPNDEGLHSTASAARAIDDLVWVNGLLVRITKAMNAGDAYVPGSNCVSSSTNEVLHYLLTTFNKRLTAEQTARENADKGLQTTIKAEQTARENADKGLQTTIKAEQTARENADNGLQTAIKAEQTARENAVTRLQAAIDAETTDREDADNILQNSIDELQQSVKNVLGYANVKNYGAKGDGTTDDTKAVQSAIASGLDLYFPNGTYKITQNIKLGCPLMADDAILLSSGATIAMKAPLASCKLHFRRVSGGKYEITSGQILGDWFIDTNLSDVFQNGALSRFTGTIFFPSKGWWKISSGSIVTSTPYHVNKKICIDNHVRYDFCGGVISFDTESACISASEGTPERSYLVNATLCATVESVNKFTEVVGSQRIVFDSMHCIGGRRVGYYKNTINVQVSNIVHDCFYNSSASYCSFELDETSGGTSGISGNASIRFYNCISSMNSLSGDSSQFIIYNSNDIRDIFIDDCECSSPHHGIQINSSGANATAWNIFIRNYVADQCIRCIYCTNLGRGAVTIDSCYFNAHDRCVEFINSTGSITNCQFIGDRESTGITITNSQGAIITGNTFVSIDHPIVFNGGSFCQVGFNTVNRQTKRADDCAFKFNGSSNNRIICNSIIPSTPDDCYTAGFQFDSTCSGNIIGLNHVVGLELKNDEEDLVKIGTTKV